MFNIAPGKTTQSTPKSIQIAHCLQRHHWVVACNILSDSGHAHIYDSLHATIGKQCIYLVTNKFGVENDSFVSIPNVQAQKGGTDCGLFAIANMTALAHGQDPSVIHYYQSKMKVHLITCFEKGKLTPFPTL